MDGAAEFRRFVVPGTAVEGENASDESHGHRRRMREPEVQQTLPLRSGKARSNVRVLRPSLPWARNRDRVGAEVSSIASPSRTDA